MAPEENPANPNSDFLEEDVTVSDITGYEEQFSMDLGHDAGVFGDLVSRWTQIGCRATPNES
jgi:hypothetical protein